LTSTAASARSTATTSCDGRTAVSLQQPAAAVELALVLTLVVKETGNSLYYGRFWNWHVIKETDVHLPQPILSWDKISGPLERPESAAYCGFAVANEHGIS
jgi:hypothetical protein